MQTLIGSTDCQEMRKLTTKMVPSGARSSAEVGKSMHKHYAEHYTHLHSPPGYAQALFEDSKFEPAGDQDVSMWNFWVEGADLKYLALFAKKKMSETVDSLGGEGAEEIGIGFHDASQEAWAKLFEKGAWDPVSV